jgi:hypothetical protein
MKIEVLRAPWDPAQVQSLNEFQHGGDMHGYTCPRRSQTPHDPSSQLLATPDGWVCPETGCQYTQDWAHAYVVDGSWRRSPAGW